MSCTLLVIPRLCNHEWTSTIDGPLPVPSSSCTIRCTHQLHIPRLPHSPLSAHRHVTKVLVRLPTGTSHHHCHHRVRTLSRSTNIRSNINPSRYMLVSRHRHHSSPINCQSTILECRSASPNSSLIQDLKGVGPDELCQSQRC